MTQEEDKKDLIKMWDDLRNNCSFNGKSINIGGIPIFYTSNTIEIVKQWKKEHQQTSTKKFNEVLCNVINRYWNVYKKQQRSNIKWKNYQRKSKEY